MESSTLYVHNIYVSNTQSAGHMIPLNYFSIARGR